MNVGEIIFLGFLFAPVIIAIIASLFDKDDDRFFSDHV